MRATPEDIARRKIREALSAAALNLDASRHPNGSYYQVINETAPAPLPLKLLGLRP